MFDGHFNVGNMSMSNTQMSMSEPCSVLRRTLYFYVTIYLPAVLIVCPCPVRSTKNRMLAFFIFFEMMLAFLITVCFTSISHPSFKTVLKQLQVC